MKEVGAEGKREEVSGRVWNKDHYEKRFGLVAIEKGFISGEDLASSLAHQVDDKVNNRPNRLLGKILFGLGVMTAGQIEEVLHEMFRPEAAGSNMQKSDGGFAGAQARKGYPVP